MGEQVAARLNGGVAQLGEHLPCKQGVKSSNLSVSTDLKQLNEFEYNDNKFCARSFVKLNRYNMLGKTSILYLENFIQIDE